MLKYNNTTEIVDIYTKYDTLQDAIDDNPTIAPQTSATSLTDLFLLSMPPALPPDPPAIVEPYVAPYVGGDGLLVGEYALQAEASQGFFQDAGSAASAYNNYVAAGGQVSQFQKSAQAYIPAALYGPAVYLQSLTGWSLGSILTVGATAVNCGAAALIGFDIGTAIQEENPEFWEEVFRTIAPWSFEAIDNHFGVLDYEGKTYLNSEVYNALRSKLISMGLSPHYSYQFNYPKYDTQEQETAFLNADGSGPIISWFTSKSTGVTTSVTNSLAQGSKVIFMRRASDTTLVQTLVANADRAPTGSYLCNVTYTDEDGQSGQESIGISAGTTVRYYRKNDQLVYYRFQDSSSVHSTSAEGVQDIYTPFAGWEYIGELAWNMVYGSTEIEYPNGVRQWNGLPVTDPYDGAIDVAVDEQGNTVKFIPFSLPDRDGDGHLDSSVNYDPTQYVNAAQQVTAYAQNQSISNYRDMLNRVDSESDPLSNPSQTGGAPSLNPTTPTPIPDVGTSPVIPPILTPPVFSPGSSAPSGLINVYNPNETQLHSFGNWLWVTYTDVSLQKILNNPFDGVISLHEIFTTPIRGASQTIRSGFLDSSVMCPTVPQRYSQLNCGSIVIPEYFRNYLDYSPYTKVYIYLPFIGIKELDPEDIIGAGVNVTYGVDSYTGACVAMITTAKDNYSSITYQWEGNCSVQYPLTGGTQMQTLIALAQGVLNGVSGLLSGGIPTTIAGAVEGVSSALDYTKVKSSVYRSGSFTGNFGAMSGKVPYVIVKRPRQVIVPNYNNFYGYPAHKYVVIGQCSGYLRCREVHVNSARATDEEKQEIESLLKAGVYVS